MCISDILPVYSLCQHNNDPTTQLASHISYVDCLIVFLCLFGFAQNAEISLYMYILGHEQMLQHSNVCSF